MGNLVYYLRDLLFFDISLLYYHINLRSSIILCLFSEDIYFFWYFFFTSVSELFCGEVLEIFVILSAILLPIKSPVASAVF